MAQYAIYPPAGGSIGTGITQAEVQAAVTVAVTIALAAQFPITTVQTRFMDTSVNNINVVSGAWVNLPGPALTVATKKVEGTLTTGWPIEVGSGPSAGSVTQLFVLNQGDGPFNFEIIIPAGTQLWVRGLSANLIDVGYITLNLLG